MNNVRSGHSASILSDGRVLVVGGSNGGVYPNNAELYDPSRGTWNTTGRMNTARVCHTTSLLSDGRVLVTGVFNGHTHNDEFNIFYSRGSPSFAINVGFNGGSATTYSYRNHNYKLFYVDNQSYVSYIRQISKRMNKNCNSNFHFSK